MKKILFIIPLFAAVALAFTSCNDDDTWDTYAEWRDTNTAWLQQQQMLQDGGGRLFYSRLAPQWDKSAYVLIHYFNDRALTDGNLSPMYTSTVDVKYIGRLYDGTPFDSSFVSKTYGDSIFRTNLTDIITGWTIALEDMRVGDSARVVIPQALGYGASQSGIIPPYSTLQFDIKLVDIPYYEIPAPN